MLKLCRVTKVEVFFLMLVYVFNFNLFEFSVAILERDLGRHFGEGSVSFSLNFYLRQQGRLFKNTASRKIDLSILANFSRMSAHLCVDLPQVNLTIIPGENVLASES